jgi:hypothetical protein
MKAVPGILLVFVIGLLMVIASGCASPKICQSGFLKDYSGFEPGPKDGADLIYIRDGVDFGNYDKIMMDEVVFYFSDGDKYEEIPSEERDKLAAAFHMAMIEAFEDDYQLVDEPGPDVLRIRPAITDVVECNPTLNTLSTIMPLGLTISTIKKSITGSHANVGGATLEGELVDSLTNERLAAGIDTKMGEKYKIFQGMSKWGHAEDAFQSWAKWLRQMVDEVRGTQSYSFLKKKK